MSDASIPVLDLNDYLSESIERKQKFIDGVGHSLSQIGFFALTNHGLSNKLLESAYTQSKQLFSLSTEEKSQYEDLKLKGQRGYTSFGREHAKDSKAPDLKEFWHVGQELDPTHELCQVYPKNVWPNELSEFKPTMTALYDGLEDCALKILEACSSYIGESPERIRDTAVDGNSILRLIHYPPIPENADPESVRAAAHEDINLITLLVNATASGLELLDKQGNWIPIVTPPGCIIVDSGDMLQNISNGFFKSTTHRVVNPDDSREERFSMPFFVHARSEVKLDPLDSCIERMGKVNYPQITAGEYLHQRLAEIGLA